MSIVTHRSPARVRRPAGQTLATGAEILTRLLLHPVHTTRRTVNKLPRFLRVTLAI